MSLGPNKIDAPLAYTVYEVFFTLLEFLPAFEIGVSKHLYRQWAFMFS